MDAKRRIVDADVVVADGKIVRIGSREPGAGSRKAEAVLDCTGLVIIPGLVQAHVHLCQTLFRGLADDRSGLEVLEQMRLDERFDDVPVVILTGVTEVDPHEAEIIDRHRAHLLYKRFGYREVVNRLEKILTAKAA